MKLEKWLSLAFFSLIVVFTGFVSLVFYTQLRKATLERVQDQLLSINILKKRLVEQSLRPLTSVPPDTAHRSAMASRLEDILTERTGMGTTGESYLVDERGSMITTSRFFPNTLPGSIRVDTEGFREARAGQVGVGVYADYRGVPIVGAYRTVALPYQTGVILTEIDVDEALRPIEALRNRFLGLSLILLIVFGVVSVLLAKQLSRPIRRIQRTINALAHGELPLPPRPTSRIVEIESITTSLGELIQALGRTVHFAQHIGAGKFDAHYTPLGARDELGQALLTMRSQLVQLYEYRDQQARQTKKLLVSTQEGERERIARDIHDGVGPLLTTAKLKLSGLPDSEAREEVRRMLGEVINELRQISRNLMPAVLRDFGPGEALDQLVEQIRQSTRLRFRYANDLSGTSRLPDEISITLYRIAQEAINNTLKHAAATEVVMSLTEFDKQVVFYYKDNGQGISSLPQEIGKGSGLKNIQERVRILNGIVRIYNDQGTSTSEASTWGTVIEAEIPLL